MRVRMLMSLVFACDGIIFVYIYYVFAMCIDVVCTEERKFSEGKKCSIVAACLAVSHRKYTTALNFLEFLCSNWARFSGRRSRRYFSRGLFTPLVGLLQTC
jgi:hypothetical protein